jgi:hypothetical protein
MRVSWGSEKPKARLAIAKRKLERRVQAMKRLAFIAVAFALLVSTIGAAPAPAVVTFPPPVFDPSVDVGIVGEGKAYDVTLTPGAWVLKNYVTYCGGGSDYDHVWFPGSNESFSPGKEIATVTSVAYWLRWVPRHGWKWFIRYDTTTGDCFTPVGQMWLLTKDSPNLGDAFDVAVGNYPCMLVSEVDAHPSVDRQKELCFVGQQWVDLVAAHPEWAASLQPEGGWVADNAPCSGVFGYVKGSGNYYGVWHCDGLMKEWHGARLPVYGPDGGTSDGTLFRVWQEHLIHTGG